MQCCKLTRPSKSESAEGDMFQCFVSFRFNKKQILRWIGCVAPLRGEGFFFLAKNYIS